jgi:murein L,D-transpeptidase YafK
MFMKKYVFLILLPFGLAAQKDFKSSQQQYETVQSAYQNKEQTVVETLKTNDLKPEDLTILLVVYKQESLLEVFAKKKNASRFELVKTLDICAMSGQMGPKRQQGDNQVPEGFYEIDRFNPLSAFHLSLGINYPNASDRILGKRNKLGGDIFIHGSCLSAGCMAITNDRIEELYLYALEAANGGQKRIPVYIFPCKMTNQNLLKLKENYPKQYALHGFWDNLKRAWDIFRVNQQALRVSVNSKGKYLF